MDFQNKSMKFIKNIYKAKVLFLSLGLLLGLSSGCGYIESRNLKSAIEQENCEEAKRILLKSLRKDLNNEFAKYNLVHAFICAGDLDSAHKQIEALLHEGSKYKFELYFLNGYILGEMGEIDEALVAYQNALDIQNKIKIKENIEILLADQKNGKSGKKKKGKSKKQEESDPNGDQKDQEPDDKQQQDKDKKDSSGDNKKENDKKKSKKMTDKQVEKIMKEIDGDEKKIRSQGLKVKSKKGGQNNEKNW